jgi:hypothetical protein
MIAAFKVNAVYGAIVWAERFVTRRR